MPCSVTACNLQAILVTHHHADHTGGVDALRQATRRNGVRPGPRTHARAAARACTVATACSALGLSFEVIDVPGHTAGHIAYLLPGRWTAHPLLFCGDTLFSGGCGRLFEGTPAQMLASLDTLAALPDATRVCCTHEYTLSNLKFALAVEPDNPALADYYTATARALRAQQPAHPALHLRAGAPDQPLPAQPRARPSSRRRTLRRSGNATKLSVFAALRQWKNQFR